MKILHILKKAPDASTKKIIEVQASGNQSKVIDLTKGGIALRQARGGSVRQRQGLLLVKGSCRAFVWECRPSSVCRRVINMNMVDPWMLIGHRPFVLLRGM